MAINQITPNDVEDFKILTEGNGNYPVNALDEYQRIATQTAIYPGKGSPLGLIYVALKGAGEAGEFAEHVGKAMRDDNLCEDMRVGTNSEGVEWSSNLTEERKIKLIKEIGDQLWYLSAKCNELGIKLSEAALINLRKLSKRSMEGTLQGSGDDR